MALDLHNHIVYPRNTFIPAVERETPSDAIHVATAGLNACDFLLSNDFKIGRKAEQRLRWLALCDVAESL
jgi:alkylhydroperoxidase family enzyme